MILIIIAIGVSACNKGDDPENTSDPADLSVEITSVDDESFTVSLQATATNAVDYRFYIGISDIPEEVNNDGFFQHTFEGPGSYEIQVRAYGSSGRYVKVSKEIQFSQQSEPVPLSRGQYSPLAYNGYDLVWQDEFNGFSINDDYWSFDIGDGCPNLCGWGNNELEYYRMENAWVGDSVLTIEARKETFMGRDYTSAKIKTAGKVSFQYGRIDIRALLPEGQGIWPALWTLGDGFSTVGWPRCGEIDMMEMIGGSGRENQVHGTAHWGNGGEHASYGQSFTLSLGTYNFSEAYHVFSIIWDENSIKWYVDDQKYSELSITGSDMTEFHTPHWFIINLAVGGNWPGNPNATTQFPQQMKVDYIRVFQLQ